MENERQIRLEGKNDALSEPLETDDSSTVADGRRHVDRAQEERTDESDLAERVAEESRCESVEVGLEIGKLGMAVRDAGRSGGDR